MKKRLQYVFMFIFAFHVFPKSVISQQNLVSNGGFEQGIEEVWELFASEGGACDFTLNNTEQHSGDRCLQAEVTTLGSNAWSIQAKNGGWSVEEGSEYEATIWMKSAAGGLTVNYTIGKATANYDEYAASYGIELTTEWQEFSLIFESAVTTSDDISLALHLSGTGTYYIDDFEVREIVNQVLSAEVNTSGTLVFVDFLPLLQDPSAELQLPFFISNQLDEYKQVDTVRVDGSNPRRLVIQLEDPVYTGEEITVEYVPGTLYSETGTEIYPFIIEAVNHSNRTPEALTSDEYRQLQLYPNPADDILNIQADEAFASLTFEISDLAGKKVLSGKTIRNSEHHIDISELQPGMYIITVKNNSNYISVNKFIKK
jgi:hypothetical protein